MARLLLALMSLAGGVAGMGMYPKETCTVKNAQGNDGGPVTVFSIP